MEKMDKFLKIKVTIQNWQKVKLKYWSIILLLNEPKYIIELSSVKSMFKWLHSILISENITSYLQNILKKIEQRGFMAWLISQEYKKLDTKV